MNLVEDSYFPSGKACTTHLLVLGIGAERCGDTGIRRTVCMYSTRFPAKRHGWDVCMYVVMYV